MIFDDIFMNLYHHKAIELKYQGYNYREISKTIGGKISEGGLRNYFAVDGKLYMAYLEYEAEQTGFRDEETRNEFRRQASYAGKVMQSILERSLRRGNDKLAFEILKEQLDRAGIVVVKQSLEKEIIREDGSSDPHSMTDEELKKALEKEGVCYYTGLSLHSMRSKSPEKKEERIAEICNEIRQLWKSTS